MAKTSNHIYFDEYSIFGLFGWKTNLAVELNDEAEDGTPRTQATMAEHSIDKQRGILVEVAGQGHRFVTDAVSVKAVKNYIRLALDDGRVDAREARVLRQMALDLLDGRLDGKVQSAPMTNPEYIRTLRRLRVA